MNIVSGPIIEVWGDLRYCPRKESVSAAGFDLHACLKEGDHRTHVPAGEWMTISTGIYLAIPEGFEGQVRPRSGLAHKHGVTVLNSPGTIDSDYRGEIKVILMNHNKTAFTVEDFDRIAQIVFAPVSAAMLTPRVTAHHRGDGGFGSTGDSVSEEPDAL